MKPIQVLILDDSLLFREMLHQELERDINIKVAAKTGDVFEASRQITELTPDVLIVDVYLDNMNGIEFVKQLLPQYYIPVIIVSGDGSKRSEAEDCGAVAFFEKSPNMQRDNIFFRNVTAKIKSIANPDSQVFDMNKMNSKVIAVGASTGGAEAIETVLKDLPPVMPPLIISQHMPAGFTRTFAERLNNTCRLSVKEAKDGDVLIPGQAYISPGGFHMSIRGRDGRYQICCMQNTQGNPICPSVDTLFASVADAAGISGIGVILTGMGRDGTVGMKKMRDAGCFTIGQNEASAVIYGMPKSAYEAGAVSVQLPLGKIAKKLVEIINK